jgi:hypothetical protein
MDGRNKLHGVILVVLGTYGILSGPLLGIARADYYGSVGTTGGASDYHYVNTGTKTELATADADAQTNGYAICSADAYTDANEGESAYALAWSYSYVIYTWTYPGPPGTTAPGGTLEWEHDGDGSVTVDGYNTMTQGGTASSSSSASNQTGVDSPSYESWASGHATGSVTNNNTPTTGDCYWAVDGSSPDPCDPWIDMDYVSRSPGAYGAGVSWDTYETGQEDIPQGTTYISVPGGPSCSCESETHTSPTGTATKAHADSSSDASVWVYATFTPN